MKTVENLSDEEKILLYNEILDRANDRYWCLIHKIDYLVPNFRKIGNIVLDNYLRSEK